MQQRILYFSVEFRSVAQNPPFAPVDKANSIGKRYCMSDVVCLRQQKVFDNVPAKCLHMSYTGRLHEKYKLTRGGGHIYFWYKQCPGEKQKSLRISGLQCQ